MSRNKCLTMVVILSSKNIAAGVLTENIFTPKWHVSSMKYMHLAMIFIVACKNCSSFGVARID